MFERRPVSCVLGLRPGMVAPCDIGLAGRCPRPRGAGPLRRCGASWRSPASRFALAVRCVRCLPMGRHHCALRSRPRPPAQRLPMGRRYPAGRSRADAEPGPARSLWRLRFGPASRWRSRFRMSEALTTWLRARGMQDLHLYGRSRFATSPAQIILPCRGARRLPRDSSRGFGCAVFAYALRRKEGPCGFDHARPSVCRYRGSSCGRGASCGAGRP